MNTILFLVFGAICALVGIGIGCEWTRVHIVRESMKRELLERAFDRLYQRFLIADATAQMLMELHDPWARLEREIENYDVREEA